MSLSVEAAVREVDAAGFAARATDVVALLDEAVRDNVSLGFLAPLDAGRAASWLDGTIADLGAGRRHVWLALGERAVIGMVHLALAGQQNAAHRGEVEKLVVARAFRRAGIASRLMGALECRARTLGRFLLVLDTDAGGAATGFYARLGWSSVGVIDDYARRPDGRLAGTRLYCRDLREAPHG